MPGRADVAARDRLQLPIAKVLQEVSIQRLSFGHHSLTAPWPRIETIQVRSHHSQVVLGRHFLTGGADRPLRGALDSFESHADRKEDSDCDHHPASIDV